MLKKYSPYIILFYVASAVSLITASFVDLKLDIALNNPTSPFSLWFEATGEMPCRLMCIFAGVLIFYLAKNPLLKLFGLLAELGGSAYLGYHIARYFFIERNNLVFGLLFGIGFGVTALYFGQFLSIPEHLKKTMLILSIAGIAIMFVQLGVIEVVKTFWGRVRFRDLLKAGSYDAFTAWYRPNGINGNKSFPSGHTAGAAMSYLTMAFPYINKEKWEKKRWLCFCVPFVFTSMVAYTRLVMGAHYLSDVTVGGVIGFTVVILGLYILEKKVFPKNG